MLCWGSGCGALSGLPFATPVAVGWERAGLWVCAAGFLRPPFPGSITGGSGSAATVFTLRVGEQVGFAGRIVGQGQLGGHLSPRESVVELRCIPGQRSAQRVEITRASWWSPATAASRSRRRCRRSRLRARESHAQPPAAEGSDQHVDSWAFTRATRSRPACGLRTGRGSGCGVCTLGAK